MKKIVMLIAVILASTQTWAGYNANMKGVIQNLNVYAAGDYIYIKLKNQPASHPGCNPSYFVITGDLPENRRNMLFSRLLAAYMSKESVNIGYDSQAGDCADGYIRVHRAG